MDIKNHHQEHQQPLMINNNHNNHNHHHDHHHAHNQLSSKHTSDINNNVFAAASLAAVAATTTKDPSSAITKVRSSMVNKFNTSDINPFIENHHHNHHHHQESPSNSVIQQSCRTTNNNSHTKSSLSSIQNIYSNNISTNNDFVENAATNAHLAQILKPFYNSMQILQHQQQQDHKSLISNENPAAASAAAGSLYMIDPDRKLNVVDQQNQFSLLSQSNDSYVHQLAVLNSEFLNQQQQQHQKKSTSDFLYHHQNVVNYQSSDNSNNTLPTPINTNYFNGYNSTPSIIGNNSIQFANSSISSVIPSQVKNLNKYFQVAQNDIANKTKSTSSTSTGNTRGRKKSQKGPFICSECRKEFANQSTLTKHLITHSDERKFVCLQCNKAFKRHDHLTGHLLTHREHKPYACDIEGCDKSYCDSRSLRRHKEKHKENIFQTDNASSLSKLPTMLATTSSEKGNNIPYLPINASTHLQFLALQQKNVPQATTTSSTTNAPSQNNNTNCTGNPSAIEDSKVDLQNELDNVNKLLSTTTTSNGTSSSDHQQQINSANENALLHQLLTNHNHDQEKTMFNTANNRQSIIHNNTSSIIKLNNNYEDPSISGSYLPFIKSEEEESTTNNQKKITREDKRIENDVEKSIRDLECSICSKKFPTTTLLHAHMRLHPTELTHQNPHHQQLNTSVAAYEFAMKSYELEMSKNSAFVMEQPPPAPQKSAFDDMATVNDIEFRNVFQQHQNQFCNPSVNITDGILVSSGSAAKQDHHNIINEPQNHQMYHQQEQQQQINGQANHMPGPSYEVASNDLSQTKGLNEVMFSPITPVTPLKNNSQFTFEFSNQSHPALNVEVKIEVEDDNINYVAALDNDISENFACFEPEKNNEDLLVQKNGINIVEDAAQANFDPLNDNRMVDNYHTNTESRVQTNNNDNQFYDSSNKDDSTFNSFDLPSKQFTSDLFHRRIKKNNYLAKELLSIKQIAANLQSFSQNYERNQHSSYSVPTTPCQISSAPPIPSSNNERCDPNDSSYPSSINNNGNLFFHHSLPNTPVDGIHFTFNNNNNEHNKMSYQQAQVNNSVPNTPVETQQTQQFNFIFPPEQQQPQGQQQGHDTNDNIINEERNFDVNCLADSGNYSEFIFGTATNNNKELNSNEFQLENINFNNNNNDNNNNSKQSQESINFNSLSNDNNDQNVRNDHQSTSSVISIQNDRAHHLNENVNFYGTTATTTTTDPTMEYEMTLTNNNAPQIQVNDSGKLLNNQQHMNQFITPIININNHNIENIHNNNHSNHQTKDGSLNTVDLDNLQVINEPVKDINSNYILPTETTTTTTTIVSNDNILDANNNLNTKTSKTDESSYPRIRSPNFIKNFSKKLPPINGSSPQLTCLKRKKPKPEPLYIPPHVNTFVYHSRLRSPRLWNTMASRLEINIPQPPYTPPPILSPVRSGSGLFWKINATGHKSCFNNKWIINDLKPTSAEVDLTTPTTAYEPYEYDIPQTDIQPHVNIGPNFQARIPEFNPNRSKLQCKSDKAVLMWDPRILNQIDEEALDLYFKISCSMCVPGRGSNKEYALHLLYYYKGDVFQALEKLVGQNPTLDINHSITNYYYSDPHVWTEEEINKFQKSIFKHEKDFFLISKEIKTKSVKDSIEFYYLWKKNSIDLAKRLKIIRRKREALFYSQNFKNESTTTGKGRTNSNTTIELQGNSNNNCDDENNPDNYLNGDSNNNQEASSSTTNSGDIYSNNNNSNSINKKTKTGNTKLFTCKKCGKKFRNLKTRAAHLKLHDDNVEPDDD